MLQILFFYEKNNTNFIHLGLFTVAAADQSKKKKESKKRFGINAQKDGPR